MYGNTAPVEEGWKKCGTISAVVSPKQLKAVK